VDRVTTILLKVSMPATVAMNPDTLIHALTQDAKGMGWDVIEASRTKTITTKGA
jgi:hypothetical protein